MEQHPRLIFSIILLNYCASLYLYIYIAINVSAILLHQIRGRQLSLAEEDENDDDFMDDSEETWETDANEQQENFRVIDEDFLHFRIHYLLEKVNRMIEGRPIKIRRLSFLTTFPFLDFPHLLFEIVHPPHFGSHLPIHIGFIEHDFEHPILWESMSIDEFRQAWAQLSEEESNEVLCYYFELEKIVQKIGKKFVRLIFDPGPCQWVGKSF